MALPLLSSLAARTTPLPEEYVRVTFRKWIILPPTIAAL